MIQPDPSTDTPALGLRFALQAVPAYKPGKPPVPRPGLTSYKISSNENPYPPLPSVLATATEWAGRMNRYPDMFVTALTERVSEWLEVPVEDVVVGPGSVGVLVQLINAMCDEDDEVVYAWRSFEAYPIVVALAGAHSVQVPLDAEARHDLDAMAAAVTARTKVVLVCSPNNPTGPSVRAAELEEFLGKVPRRVLVVIDEAYLEFVRDEDQIDGIDFYRRHPNVMVLRTFSKAYGLAGLRVGYGVAHDPVSAGLRKCALPFGVTEIAQRCAIASLAAADELAERVAAIVDERARVVAALAEQGWKAPDTQANFVWLPLGEDTEAFTAAAAEAGLSVRPFAGEGARCSIDVPEANDQLLKVAKEFLARSPR
jgi:histidinol-phosphate aminotransferase